MKNKLEKLLNNEITFADFLLDSEKDLDLASITLDAEGDKMIAKFGDDKAEVGSCGFDKNTGEQDLGTVLEDLKNDWKKILNEKGYKKDLDAFMAKYKLSKVLVNLQNEEVTFHSGKNHLVEGLDLYNQ